jgi:predicted phosphodiesterase
MSFPSKSYQRHVAVALDAAYANAADRAQDFVLGKDRLVIFSDHHKGVRDAADDFSGAQGPYHAALGYYLEEGFTLGILGDAEELWEDDPGPVLAKYKPTLDLERAFYIDGHRYWRVWGNHDDDWRFRGLVARHLWPIFPDIEIHESSLLIVRQGGKEIGRLFLVHGHQGTLEGDRLGGLMKLVVRHIWRPLQRRTAINLNTPSTDWRLRMRQNIALYNWAVVQEGLALIAGHTHHPVFYGREARIGSKGLKNLERELAGARTGGNPGEIAAARARLEFARVPESARGLKMEQPCYFNTGCCCFADGDITGLEIDRDTMRLVRWLAEGGSPRSICLAEMKLIDVLRKVAKKGRPLEKPQE